MSNSEFLDLIKSQYPQVAFMHIEFSGSGDDFDSFGQIIAEDHDGKEIRIGYQFLEDHENFLYEFVNDSHISFTDVGEDGKVEINLVDMTINLYES